MATPSSKKDVPKAFSVASREASDSTHFGTLFVVYIALLAAGAIVLFQPRAVTPGPGLYMPELRGHQETAIVPGGVPTGEQVDEIRRVYREASVAEAQAFDGTLAQDRRYLQAEARESLTALEAEVSEDAVSALRSEMARDIVEAVLSEDPAPERVGGFVSHLIRYGVIRDNRLEAPRVVVRALAKARWNAMFGRELLEGLSNVETQAYWGWLAFNAVGAETERRLGALNAFEAAGGPAAPTLRASLLARLGSTLEASNIMDEHYRRTGNIRFRNHALALVQAAAGEELTAP